MNDYISRQDAIDALEKLSANYTAVGKREWHPHVRECQKEIECLPSAQPERKKGEWIHKPDIYLDEQTWECSECGEPWIFIDGTPSENNANYCPNCGADMRPTEPYKPEPKRVWDGNTMYFQDDDKQGWTGYGV